MKQKARMLRPPGRNIAGKLNGGMPLPCAKRVKYS
ncbi:hypothetical protein EV202_101134 [Bacteroides heparinolyticus]|uniref:Uncharacterized protein n=1 Tax=Prevotella heparinolytica TaxID=28113 RepID=A0A4R2LXV5_9BACE|nr:hypothetical protein EV202_101134 [Bacteroides heparinolyticus]